MRSYFNTDKIFDHGYFSTYLTIAASLGPFAKVCEFGVERGDSLRMWQSLFPQGEVTGVDMNPGCHWPDGTKRVLALQDDPVALANLGPFDLIVDDASHVGKTTQKTFEIMWPQVAPRGVYVVEDWFIGIEKHINGAYDPAMLETVQGFLRLLTKGGDCESVSYRYGLAVVRKKAK